MRMPENHGGFVRWLLVLCCLFSLRPLQAAPDIDSFDALEWVLADHPKSLEVFARKAYRSNNPQVNPRRWLHALWLYGFLVTSTGDVEWQEAEDLEKAINLGKQIAESQDFHEELIRIQLLEAERNSRGKETLDRQFYERALTFVDRYQLSPHLRMTVLGYYSYALRDAGLVEEGMELMQKAYELLVQDPKASALDQILVRTNLALTLRIAKKNSRAQELLLEIEKIFAQNQLRTLHASNLYNLGVYNFSSTPPDLTKAHAYFQESLQLAATIDDKVNIASNLLGLSGVYSDQNKNEDAFKQAIKAAEIFQTLKNPVWEGEAYVRAANPLLNLKRYHETLRLMDRASAVFPVEYDNDHRRIAEIRYEAHKGLGQFGLALEQLEKERTLDIKIANAREDKAMADKMVKLGLQVEEEKNKVLHKDNELQAHRLQEAQRLHLILLGGLVLAFIALGLMVFAIRESQKVKEGRLRMQRILDTIDEGILTIDPRLQIEAGYSRYLQTLLGANEIPLGRDAIDSLFRASSLNSDESQLIRQVLLACFGEDDDAWNFNSHQLPTEVIWHRTDRNLTLTLHWQPIFDPQSRLQRVLLGIRDVTDRRLMEAEMLKEKQKSERLSTKLSELVSCDPMRVKELLQRMETLNQSAGAQQEVMRSLHTAKGISRALRLRSLSAAIHDCESALIQNSSLGDSWNLLQQELQDYQHIMQNILHQGPFPLRALNPTLASRVVPMIPELTGRISQEGLEWGGLLIDDQLLPWPQDLLDLVADLLIHALTNSLDHGFILPKNRGLDGSRIQLSLRALPRQEYLHLFLEDNGAGIDTEKLKQLAQQRGFTFSNEKELLALLFADGFSTAQKTTETSGRGVGLAALRSLCESRHGSVSLRNRTDARGACLEVILPLPAEYRQATAS